MYLSRLRINRRHPLAQIDLNDRYELHRSLLSAFPQPTLPEERILYRVEFVRPLPYVAIRVHSLTWPEWENLELISGPGYLFQAPAMQAVDLRLSAGSQLRFRLVANPTRKRKGKRYPISGQRKLMGWLQRKAIYHGFAFEPRDVNIEKLRKVQGKGNKLVWHAVRFDGALEVIEARAFAKALRYGIGSARCFGFGLLSVRHLPECVLETRLAA